MADVKKTKTTVRRRWRRYKVNRKNQVYYAKISTICKLYFPPNGQNFVFNLTGQKAMTLENVLNNSEYADYAKLFNLGQVYGIRIQANYIERPNYFHIYPVAIGIVPNELGGLETSWETVRSCDSCLMLNNTNCKMYRRLINTKFSTSQLNTSNDVIILAESQARPSDNTGNEWGIKIDLYVKFYGSKI